MAGVVRTTRVLFVAGTYPPELSAGGLQCAGVARVLRGQVEIAALATSTDPSVPVRDQVDGVRISRIRLAKNRWGIVRTTVRMAGELMRLVPWADVVHIQGFSTKNILVSAVARLTARPVVISLQTSRHDEPPAVRAQGRLAWWAFSTADQYLSVSPGLAASYRDGGLPPNRVRIVPNGVDVSRFTPASVDERTALRRTLHLPLDLPVVLFVGVISPDKQPQVLLDAWVPLQADPATASTLVFVGATNPSLFELEGRLIDRLRAAAAASGYADRVIFVPPTTRIEDYFRAADVFAMPSLREGLPIALLEAMACGLPCVASHLPGATDSVIDTGVNGRLVRQGDVAAWTAALGELIADPAVAARLGAAARQTVAERYTIERVAGMWLDAYHDVLAKR